MADLAPEVEPSVEEAQRLAKCSQKWIAELGVSERFQRKWLERAKKITRRYLSENRQEDDKRRFAILWSNTETIKPAVYSRPPQPVVMRRFDDADPVGRVASEVLERGLSTSIELQGFDQVMRLTRDDYVLVARGQTWARYAPTHGPQVIPQIDLQPVTNGEENEIETPGAEDEYEDDEGNRYKADQAMAREDGSMYAEGEPYEPVVYEEAITDYVNWADFGHSVARTWDEVWYVWRRVYLDRKQLIARFGTKLGKLVPLDWGPIQQGQRDTDAMLSRKAAIYEIWDRTEKKVYWISKSWSSRPLDERDDPLGLSNFFPCPRPLLATTGNESVMPVADYVFYQDQAEEIDKLTARIAELQDALKVRGFYAGDGKTNLTNLLNSPNNTLIPVPEWLRLKEGGGAQGMIEYWPIAMVVAALDAIVTQRQQLISDVYQITGVADILRGMNDPRATATAERIKGAWGTLRIRTKQIEMMRFACDCLRIKAEIIAEKFDVETLKAISGVKLATEAEKQQMQALIEQGKQAYQMQVQQAQMMHQQQAAQMQAQGQQVPPFQPPTMPEIPPEMQEALAQPSWEDVVGLLRDNAARQFRIEVETDSTIEPDEQEQKANVIELTTALSGFIAQWGPAVAANPALGPLAGALIKNAVRRFRAGRELEAVIDQTIESVMAGAAKPAEGQAPPPDKTPVEVAQINLQRETIKQTGEDQRAKLEAQVQQGDQQIRAQDNQLKVVMGGRDPQPQVSY